MHDVFVSYSGADHDAASALADSLRHAGFSTFFDTEGLVAGLDWSQASQRELETSRSVLAILSTHSQQSMIVQSELRRVLHQKRLIIPVMLDDAATENAIWPLLADRAALRLDAAPHSREWDNQVEAIVSAVARSLSPPSPPPTSPSTAPAPQSPRSESSPPPRSLPHSAERKGGLRLGPGFVIAVLSALAGAAAMWLALK
ncbi:hypothetical protein ABI59_12100 [Acidobacteria bacterium Mor1]|nr:hypothetical protein ABI59_12100 [Acidobacteria bacterium Mor1]